MLQLLGLPSPKFKISNVRFWHRTAVQSRSSYAQVPRRNDNILAGYTQVKCEKEVKSDGIMHTENASFRKLGQITEQADPTNLVPQFYGNRAVSHD